MVSARTLMNRKSNIITPNVKEWFLDSGAFTYLKKNGKYPFSIGKYLSVVAKYSPDLWANMDYPCEKSIRNATKLNILQHIGNTIENGRQLIDFDPDTFVMVLQGIELREYEICIDYCKDYGLFTKVMGIGSVCGRRNQDEVFQLLRTIRSQIPDWCKIHTFGTGIHLLKDKRIYQIVDSIDTWGWNDMIGLSRVFHQQYKYGSYNAEALALLKIYKKKVNKIKKENER